MAGLRQPVVGLSSSSGDVPSVRLPSERQTFPPSFLIQAERAVPDLALVSCFFGKRQMQGKFSCYRLLCSLLTRPQVPVIFRPYFWPAGSISSHRVLFKGHGAREGGQFLVNSLYFPCYRELAPETGLRQTVSTTKIPVENQVVHVAKKATFGWLSCLGATQMAVPLLAC